MASTLISELVNLVQENEDGKLQQTMNKYVPSLHWMIPYYHASEIFGISALSIFKSFRLHPYICMRESMRAKLCV
ncbi:hypothetical protein Peur_061224 [Populus x canadensis]|jgi:hypothetical protein